MPLTRSPLPAAWSRELAAGLACAALGALIAAGPNLAAVARYGSPYYLADLDDTYYLSIARAPYYEDPPALRDPYLPPSRRVPTLHTWWMFAPGALACRVLGLPLLALTVLWRVFGGASLGGALYVLFRVVLGGTSRPAAWAAGCAVVCLADAGFGSGKVGYEAVELVANLGRGTTPLSKPDAMPQYRVVTPLLNLWAYLLLLACLAAPWARAGRGALAGAACLAACVYLYFYYWTAAALALGLFAAAHIGMAFAGARERRADHLGAVRFAGLVLLGGLVLGAPGIVSTAGTGSDPSLKPILERISKGYRLPEGSRFAANYLLNTWVWGKLALGAAGGLMLGVRRTGFLWCATLAGYLLINSALVTGMEFENFHWAYCFNASGEVLALATLAPWLGRKAAGRRGVAWGLAAVPAVLVALALVWRPYEALRAREPVAMNAALGELNGLRPALARLGPEFVLAGEPPAVYVALLLSRCSLLNHTLHYQNLALIPDREVHERDALDAWLRGLDLAAYERSATLDHFGFTQPGDPRWPPEAIRRERVGHFRALLDGDTTLLRRYPVDGLLRRTADGPPPRGGPWVRLDGSPVWTVWVRPAGN